MPRCSAEVQDSTPASCNTSYCRIAAVQQQSKLNTQLSKCHAATASLSCFLEGGLGESTWQYEYSGTAALHWAGNTLLAAHKPPQGCHFLPLCFAAAWGEKYLLRQSLCHVLEPHSSFIRLLGFLVYKGTYRETEKALQRSSSSPADLNQTSYKHQISFCCLMFAVTKRYGLFFLFCSQTWLLL